MSDKDNRKFNPKIAKHARKLIGEFIRTRREDIKYSQAKVSEISGVRQADVSNVENGGGYTIDTLIAILGTLRVEIKFETHEINSIPHFGKPTEN